MQPSKADKKAAKVAAAAAAAAAADRAKGSKTRIEKLPGGQWCWSNTCNYNHPKGTVCYRAPWTRLEELPATLQSNTSALESFNKGKDLNISRKVGVGRLVYFPTGKAPAKGAVPFDAQCWGVADDDMDGMDALRPEDLFPSCPALPLSAAPDESSFSAPCIRKSAPEFGARATALTP